MLLLWIRPRVERYGLIRAINYAEESSSCCKSIFRYHIPLPCLRLVSRQRRHYHISHELHVPTLGKICVCHHTCLAYLFLSLGFHTSTNFVLPDGTSEVSVFSLQRPRTVTGLDTIYFWVNLMDSLTEVLRQLWLGYLPVAAGL